MERMADLLELINGAHTRTFSLEVEFRDWIQQRPTTEVLVDEHGVGDARLRWRGAGPWPREIVRTRRVWAVPPGRLRIEVLSRESLVLLAVRDQNDWWRWEEFIGTTTGEVQRADSGRTMPPLLDPPLLNPVALLTAVRMEPTGSGTRAGREVILVRGEPRHRFPSPRALSYEFEFDAEHGTLLRRAAFADGLCFQVSEAIRVGYGAKIKDEKFVFVAPDGDPARSTGLKGGGSERQRLTGPNGKCRHSRANGIRGQTVWLTGLSGAGKSTTALALADLLRRRGQPACVLDGDVLRRGLSEDLGLAPAERAEQARRTAHVAAMISSSGIVAIAALVSPYAEDRALARDIHDANHLPFFEIWLDTPLAVCEERDSKGLYARARRGELQGLTGLDAPYEAPAAPDLRIDCGRRSPEQAAGEIIDLLHRHSISEPIPALR